jgi:hypothetical protein
MLPALNELATQHGFDTSKMTAHDFRAKEASREHNWEADPKGGDYLGRLRARYGPSIRRRLELFKRQELEPALREAIKRSRQGPEARARGGKVKRTQASVHY